MCFRIDFCVFLVRNLGFLKCLLLDDWDNEFGDQIDNVLVMLKLSWERIGHFSDEICTVVFQLEWFLAVCVHGRMLVAMNIVIVAQFWIFTDWVGFEPTLKTPFILLRTKNQLDYQVLLRYLWFCFDRNDWRPQRTEFFFNPYLLVC